MHAEKLFVFSERRYAKTSLAWALIDGTRRIISDRLSGNVYVAHRNVDRGNPNEICQTLHRSRRDYRVW